jgi:anaerobic selenocysteine-containing dehydrogenase
MALSTEKAQSSQWATPQSGYVEATVHPDAAVGFRNGALCRLQSSVSSMIVRLKLDPRQRRDVVLLPKGGHLDKGQCANALVRARTTDIGEGGALYDERVRIVPV